MDYHDTDAAIKEIQQVTQGGVTQGLECIGGITNAKLAFGAFGPKGGLLRALIVVPDVSGLRKDVRMERILMYTIGGYVSLRLPSISSIGVIPMKLLLIYY